MVDITEVSEAEKKCNITFLVQHEKKKELSTYINAIGLNGFLFLEIGCKVLYELYVLLSTMSNASGLLQLSLFLNY
jgi:hypothetical protein